MPSAILCPICEKFEDVRTTESNPVKIKVCDPCRTELEKERV